MVRLTCMQYLTVVRILLSIAAGCKDDLLTSGWTFEMDLGKYYKRTSAPANYFESAGACEAEGGRLAVFRTQAEWEAVRGNRGGSAICLVRS